MKKTIFISGGSKGIGFAVAKKFYEEGFEVAICARRIEGLQEAKAILPNLHTYICDISDKQAVKRLAEQLVEQFGALDVLVNNGGIYIPGQIHTETDDVFERIMTTNLASAYYLTKGVLAPMLTKRSGTIINMCSIASRVAHPNSGSYGISKFALLGFSKSLREEMKPYNIRVIAVLPGAVLTPSWDWARDVPKERFIPVEDIAKVVWNAWEMSERTVIEEVVIRPALGDLSFNDEA